MEYTSETLYRAYRSMKLIREFEERIRAEYQQGNLPGFIHVYRGQEAIAVGVCLHLGDEDYIASTHRGHGHCIAKGCDIEDMLLELACKQDGICKGKGGATCLQGGPDGDKTCHACIESSLDYLGTVCIKVRKVEVAMSIDQHSALNLMENPRKRRLL